MFVLMRSLYFSGDDENPKPIFCSESRLKLEFKKQELEELDTKEYIKSLESERDELKKELADHECYDGRRELDHLNDLIEGLKIPYEERSVFTTYKIYEVEVI